MSFAYINNFPLNLSFKSYVDKSDLNEIPYGA